MDAEAKEITNTAGEFDAARLPVSDHVSGAPPQSRRPWRKRPRRGPAAPSSFKPRSSGCRSCGLRACSSGSSGPRSCSPWLRSCGGCWKGRLLHTATTTMVGRRRRWRRRSWIQSLVICPCSPRADDEASCPACLERARRSTRPREQVSWRGSWWCSRGVTEGTWEKVGIGGEVVFSGSRCPARPWNSGDTRQPSPRKRLRPWSRSCGGWMGEHTRVMRRTVV